MTATDELRLMLDERGVEWRRTPHYSSESIDNETVFRGEGIEWIANDHLNGHIGLRALRYQVTPVQAIEATLGRGTCRFKTINQFVDARRSRADICECDRCGYRCARGFIHDERFKYCPNCGRKVVDA